MKEFNKWMDICHLEQEDKNTLLDTYATEYDGILYDNKLYLENIEFFRKIATIPKSILTNKIIHELVKRKKTTNKEIESLLKISKNNILLENHIKDEFGLTTEKYATLYKSNLTPTEKRMINEMTKDIETHAQGTEVKVSAIMKSLQEEKVKLVGFDNRFKSTENISRSLIKVINEFPHITIEEAILSICDALRYTLVIDEDEYQEKVLEKIQILKNLGYEMTHLKNAWGNPLYQGINIGFKNKTDIEFEVQFHTEASYMVKDKINHIFYEITRNNTTSIDSRFFASEIMKEVQSLFVKTMTKALCINISYVNNSMIKYRVYTDYEAFYKKYQEDIIKWCEQNKEAIAIIKNYIQEDITKIGTYSVLNSILRGVFKNNNLINVFNIEKNIQYTKEEFEKIVNKPIEEYEKESLNYSKILNDSIKKLELIEDTVMYRGININALEKYNIDIENDTAEIIYQKLTKDGHFYIDKGFMSASPILTDLINSKNIILIMNCKEKTKGINLSFLDKENPEFLFPMNSKFHIDTVTKNNNKVYIHVSSL